MVSSVVNSLSSGSHLWRCRVSLWLLVLRTPPPLQSWVVSIIPERSSSTGLQEIRCLQNTISACTLLPPRRPSLSSPDSRLSAVGALCPPLISSGLLCLCCVSVTERDPCTDVFFLSALLCFRRPGVWSVCCAAARENKANVLTSHLRPFLPVTDLVAAGL